jgi:hypothetical protein
MPTISVTEAQFLAIANGANALCPSDRDRFYATVAAETRRPPHWGRHDRLCDQSRAIEISPPRARSPAVALGGAKPRFEQISKSAV